MSEMQDHFDALNGEGEFAPAPDNDYAEAPGEDDYEGPRSEGRPSMPSATDKLRKEGVEPFQPEAEHKTGFQKIAENIENLSAADLAKDDPTAQSFLDHMTEQGMDAAAINEALKWNAATTQAELAEQDVMDQEAIQTGLTELNRLWGEGNVQGNLQTLKDLFQSAPGGVWEGLNGARLPDGKPILSDPEFLQWALNLNHQASTLRNDPGRGGNHLAGRIKEIETFMKTNRREYNRDEAMQTELRNLYGQRGY